MHRSLLLKYFANIRDTAPGSTGYCLSQQGLECRNIDIPSITAASCIWQQSQGSQISEIKVLEASKLAAEFVSRQ